MLLALDIGNTNIKFGVFTDGCDGDPYTPTASWRINTERGRMADEYGLMVSNLLKVRVIRQNYIT